MLANKPILSILILITTNLVIVVAAAALSLLIPSIDQISDQIIQIIVTFIFWCLLVFLLVPFGYKLPKKYDTFGDYVEGIHLTTYKPFSRVVFYTISCYCIFVLFQLIGSLIYGQYVFDISRIIPPQSFWLLNINAGLFEEIMFRGIILSILLAHYSERKSIWVSAVFFGVVHYANLLHEFNNELLIFTTAQVVWAIGMGFLWAILTIKTNSLIPSIILHYLSNALDSLWLYIPTSSVEISLLNKLMYAKFIPIIVSIIWIRFISNKSEKIQNPRK
ncbi:MAG: CPBP family intramembrane metalloprotease [Candidatus Lokiarchaeota archaeon]|nr:CPBP family intramembrane metalloprotease [Candidatus Lokiarchaeota archaeon]